jgi:hypothetical protein
MNYLDEIINRANKAMGKKLTTKDRKKMKSGTFCGPGRSFPVNDCQHAATAKAFLGRSKFSKSTKQKIAACINRKAKALGCKGEKKAKADIDITDTIKLMMESEEFAATRLLVEQSLQTPDLDLNWEEEAEDETEE